MDKYKQKLIILLKALEVQHPEEAAELSEKRLEGIGKIITLAARKGSGHWPPITSATQD